MAVQDDDQVLEIGPGRGALTEELVNRTQNLILIEIDRDLVAHLQRKWPNATTIAEDVLKLDAGIFQEQRVVGNLPYNISTPLISRLLSISHIVDMHFMLQREVADRLVAFPETKDYGRLSVMAQYQCRIEKLFDVTASSFSPPPQVQSSFIYLQHRKYATQAKNEMVFTQVVKSAFAHRRKTIGNALRNLDINWDRTPVQPSQRPEEISIDDFVSLSNCVLEQ